MEKVKLSNEIISSIARTYQYISRIDIQADYFEEINNRDTEHLKFTKSGKLSESNEKVCRQYVAEAGVYILQHTAHPKSRHDADP